MYMQFRNGDAHRLIVKEEDIRLSGGADDAGGGGGDQLRQEAKEPPGEMATQSPSKEFESQGHASPDSVQQEIDKWVEFYDNLKSFLQTGVTCVKSMQKAAENFSLGNEGSVYRTKPPKVGLVFPKTLVIRNYEDRLRICKDIHVNTGEEGIHHRRDKMMELIGQQYYWKGQRRDICECIASCEICSSGLGARRKSKPPRQARDVRSPAKLQKLSTSPFTVSSSIATAKPFTSATDAPTKPATSLATTFAKSSFTDSSRAGSSSQPTLTAVTGPCNQCQSAGDTASTGSELGREQRCDFDLPSLNSSDIGAVSTSTAVFLDPSFSAQGFQIFTTINEPTANEEANVGSMSLNSPSQPNSGQSSNIVPVSAALVTQSGALGDALPSQQQPKSVTASGSSESCVYQLMFQLPSEPNMALSSSVIDAMHMAMQRTTDATQLSKACEVHLCQHLGLGSGYSVAVAPSRAAAYVIAVAASMLRADPLSINQQLATNTSSSPMAVIHDACCQNNPLKACTPLVGAVNWNLGGVGTPMDKSTLAMALAHNRVVAVLYQPYAYPQWCQQMPLQDLSEVCHSHGTVTVAVDAAGMHAQELSLIRFITSVKNFFDEGADVVLLPGTERIRGPPQTCVLVGRSAILGDALQNVALLQSRVCLPLTSTAYDLVGTVVAYKTLQADTVKQTLAVSTRS